MKKLTISVILLIVLIMIPGIIFATEEVSTEAELREALESGKSVVLKNDIVISETTKSILTTDDRNVGIVINEEGNITIDGNGKTISSSKVKSIFEIYAAESSKINVTFENVKLEANKVGGRCIDTRTANIVLNINNSTLTSFKGTYDQTLTIGGSEKFTTPIEVNLNNSNIISKSHYAIITFNPVKLNINSCEAVAGFSAVYMKEGSVGSEVIINNSKLSGTNKGSAKSGAFGTITLEESGIKIDVKDSTIIAKEESTGYQFALFDQKGNTVTIDNSKIEADQYSLYYTPNTKITLGDKTIIVDPSISSEEILNGFMAADTVCKKTGTNEYTIFKQYSITVKNVEGGNLSIDKTKSIYGETICLGVAIQEGYEFKTIEISDGNKTKNISDGEYVLDFESDVTLTPIFENLAPVVEIPKEVVIDSKTEEMLLGSLEEILKENEELATLVNNNKVELEVVLEDVKVEDEEKETIQKAIEEKVKDIKVAKYIDISINVRIMIDEIEGGKVVDQLEKLKEKLTFSVAIPTDLPKVEEGYSRMYYIVRNHDGGVEILETKVSEDGKTLNFSSDKFSTYAIAYSDVKNNEKDVTPKTGSLNISMYILIAFVTILFVKVLVKKKK